MMADGTKVGGIFYTVDADTAALQTSAKSVDEALDKNQKSFGKTDASAKKTGHQMTATAKAAREAAGGFSTAGSELSKLTKLALAYLSLRTVGYLANLSDAYGQNASRIKNATDSTEEYEMVQARLLQTANGTYRALGEAQEVYLATSDTLKSLGYNIAQVLDVTDSLSYAFVRDAARADQATSAMDAYSKALQKGKIDADAWATMMAATPSLVDGISVATGRTAKEIRTLGATGKLSVEALNEGLLVSLAANKAAADAMTVSTKDATTQINNALTVFVGKVNEAAGASDVFVDAAKQLSDALQDPSTIQAAADMASAVVKALTTIMDVARDVVGVVRWMAEETAAAMHGAAVDDVVRLSAEMERFQRALNVNRENPEKNAKVIAYLEKEIEKREQLIALSQRPSRSSATPTPAAPSGASRPTVAAERAETTTGKSAAEKQYDKIKAAAEQYIKALKLEADAVAAMTQTQKLRYDVENELIKLNPTQLAAAQQLAQQIDTRAQNERDLTDALNATNAALAAKARLDAEIAGYQADVSGVGLGERERAEQQKRLDIQSEYARRSQEIELQRVQALASAAPNEQERVRAQYDALLQIEHSYHQQSVAAYEQSLQDKRAAEGDWLNGFKSAMSDYVATSQNTAQIAADATRNVIDQVSSGIAGLVQGNKTSFADMTRSVLANLVQIAVQSAITKAAMAFFPGFSGGGPVAVPGFATGGYTGPGGTNQPAGIVHKGEVVWSKADVRAAGGVGQVEALRTGVASPIAGAATRASGSTATGGMNVTVAPVLQLSVTGGANESPAMQSNAADLGGMLTREMEEVSRRVIAREQKPGGSIWAMTNGRR